MTARTSKLKIERYFTDDKTSPYDTCVWENRTAQIKNASGEVIFEQNNVRVPEFWSMTATNIVASKYFYGTVGTPNRETGVDRLIQRVADKITDFGINNNYFITSSEPNIFRDELAYMLIHQIGAFNSPVWFNVGCDLYEKASAGSWHWLNNKIVFGNDGYKYPQCSACFINSVEDSMEGIMRLATTEAMLFKFGSGTGTNFSSLRSSKEAVSGGGVASGPLSFMKGLDAFAGVIKSGGKTRRAAKMAILNVDHPDIVEFIECKQVEERKAQALMREGYDGSSGPDSEAYSSIYYQNANNSVRVSDAFMEAAATGKEFTTRNVKDKSIAKVYQAEELLEKMATAAWGCGDPGIQFDDTINRWHTSSDTARINSSNPCSEYMFLDNSACNLASLNLMKFLAKDNVFHVNAFKHAVGIFIIAQDIIVDMSGYPTETIAKNSHDFRPLGLGYANLGALLMASALPYDSPEGRALAAGITSIMTGHAYLVSAQLAQRMPVLEPANVIPGGNNTGACPGYADNDEPFLKVIELHKDAAKAIDDLCPQYLSAAAENVWSAALSMGMRVGYRNSQVTVLAPTGTIGFMMDCDTTGIEPELSLIKYKKLVGGGQLKIVNETVGRALNTLNYSEHEIATFIDYIQANGCLENCPNFSSAHLPVFDTSFTPQNGKRSIHYSGHVNMMAATQPFLSGAISKTVNMPADSTVKDVMQAYITAWKAGLKSIAIYRDGSKSNQVLVTSKTSSQETPINGPLTAWVLANILSNAGPEISSSPEVLEILEGMGFVLKESDESFDIQVSLEQDPELPPAAVRHRLPETRPAFTTKFSVGGHEGYLTVGLYKDGRPGEIFIKMAKEGSTLSGLMDSFALVFSLALQHGVPLKTLTTKLAHSNFEPSGWTGNPDIGYAKSVMDYLARWLDKKFALASPIQGPLDPILPPIEAYVEPDRTEHISSVVDLGDSPFCSTCGSMMVKSGTCFKCTNCGGSSGCS